MNEWDSMFSVEEKEDRLTAIKFAELLNGISVDRSFFILEQAKNLVKTQSKVNVETEGFTKLANAWKDAKTI